MNGNANVSQAGSTVGSRQGGASMNNTQTKKTPVLAKQLSNNSTVSNSIQ
jgi:hypothetical protein